MVLQSIAEGVSANYPEADSSSSWSTSVPEEVFEMEAAGFGEVIASSFDNPAQRHVAVAELTLERARRRVELGEDVVLIVDSLTRLARAYNTVEKGTGRTLSGGLDAQSLEKPKRFLGSARRIDPSQGGGSLTIIATALVDTGSKMDQVIFEEFKGTGNSELVLSRELAERRIFPAIDLVASATRREELLLIREALAASQAAAPAHRGHDADQRDERPADRSPAQQDQCRADQVTGCLARAAAPRLARSNSFMKATRASTDAPGARVVDAGPHAPGRTVALEPVRARAWWPRLTNLASSSSVGARKQTFIRERLSGWAVARKKSLSSR